MFELKNLKLVFPLGCEVPLYSEQPLNHFRGYFCLRPTKLEIYQFEHIQKLLCFINFFVGWPNFKLKFQIGGGKIFNVVKLEFSSQPSGRTNFKFFELKHLRILFSLNPHYRYVVRYSLKCLISKPIQPINTVFRRKQYTTEKSKLKLFTPLSRRVLEIIPDTYY